ncbi:phosphatidylglycerol lysyltransferase domain-containing protein, partial [Bacteroides heparinolyticus]
MISFKDIELSDRELITRYTQNSPRRNCDLSFSNLCSWRFLYNTQFAILDGYLLLKFWAEEELVYMMPIGNGDLKKVLEALIEDAHQEGKPFCLLGICSGMCSELETFMPGKFQFTADRDYAD